MTQQHDKVTQRKLDHLRRLIDHPATSAEERDAARAAIARILKVSEADVLKAQAQRASLAAIFKKRMNSR